MSKAKELAREALEIFHWVTASNQEMNTYKKLTKLHDIANQILDEPSDLKGWIETRDKNSLRTLLHLDSGNYLKEMPEEEGENCRAIFNSSRGIVCFIEFYDDLKNLIRRANE